MKIVYMVNARCNTRCLHCYRGKNIADKSEAECEDDIRQLLDKGHDVIIAGAEVLCDPGKIRLYKLVGQEYLLSNGIIPANNPTILKILVLHGIKKIHLSGHIGFPELTELIPEETTARAIKNILQEKLSPVISCVISNRNFDKLDKIIEFLMKTGVKEVKFLQLLPTNRRTTPYVLTDYQRKNFLEQIEKARQGHNKQELYIKLHANFNATITNKSMEAKHQGLFCPAGKNFIVIETNDKLYPCPFLAKSEFCIGHLQKGQIVMNRTIYHDGADCLAGKILMAKSS